MGDVEFDTVGQRATFPESIFRDVLLGGGKFVVESKFQKVGFTQKELSDYGPFGERIFPSASFESKLNDAQTECEKVVAALKGGFPVNAAIAAGER